MRISKGGLDIIKRFEGLRLEAYLPTPNDVPTIGYGHTKGVQLGDVITEEKAEEFLREDLAWTEKAVNRLVYVPLTQNQYDALCSLVFNIGERAFQKSTLLRMLNKRDYLGAANQFPMWRKQGGTVLAGLVARRGMEKTLFERKDNGEVV